MMEISSKFKYTLLALLELAKYHEQGELLPIEQIAFVQQIPEPYLEQILMILRRSGLVYTRRRVKGGYLLSNPPEQITLLEILNCLEGVNSQQQCVDASQTIGNILIQEIWQEAMSSAMAVFEGYTLRDICYSNPESFVRKY
ncbi:RrF2 family transcriptional regulator [Nostoc sp.]|uniref:RrF2 family transcriptional regulator n=1 Tax=Nostoc sp. TaxID=1180 RepID=UPI002FF8F66B